MVSKMKIVAVLFFLLAFLAAGLAFWLAIFSFENVVSVLLIAVVAGLAFLFGCFVLFISSPGSTRPDNSGVGSFPKWD